MSALERFHRAPAAISLEYPGGSGRRRILEEVVLDSGERLVGIDLADASAGGRRPVFVDVPRFHDDPAWHDALLFHEYFRGAELGASHQTGWTGMVADRVVHLSRAWDSRASS